MLSSGTTLLIQMSGLSYNSLIEMASSPFPPPLSNHYSDLGSRLTEIHVFSKCTKLILLVFISKDQRNISSIDLWYCNTKENKNLCETFSQYQESVCKARERNLLLQLLILQEHGESRQAWQIFFSFSISQSQRQAQAVPDSVLTLHVLSLRWHFSYVWFLFFSFITFNAVDDMFLNWCL